MALVCLKTFSAKQPNPYFTNTVQSSTGNCRCDKCRPDLQYSQDCSRPVDDKGIGRPSYVSEDSHSRYSHGDTLSPYLHEWRVVPAHPTHHYPSDLWECVNCGMRLQLDVKSSITHWAGK